MPSMLFSDIRLRDLTLPNRLVVSPMCQYSADDGCATPWHLQHLAAMAMSGAGLVILEATAVERRGRITHGCLGLYSDANEAALESVLSAVRRMGPARLGIQLGHAGRKASSQRPWEGGRQLPPDQDPWPTDAASAVPFEPERSTPAELDSGGLARIRSAFVAAAGRARRLGLDLIELHGAHGYLLHQFLSPLSNRRTDAYGGSLANRLRFPLEVAEAVRAVWDRPLGMRLSATDWVEGGFTVEEAIELVRRLKAAGLDYVVASSGGSAPAARVPVGPGYQVPLAQRIRAATGMTVMAVGMIVEPQQAEAIVAEGQADLVAVGRGFLDDPRWGWHAAAALGAAVPYPPQYARAAPAAWPGAGLVRPGGGATRAA